MLLKFFPVKIIINGILLHVEQIKEITVLEDTGFEAVTEHMLKSLDNPVVIEVMIDQHNLRAA